MSYTGRNSIIKFANTEKSVQALFRFGIAGDKYQININVGKCKFHKEERFGY
jgi:hypothetical protein